MKQHRIEKPSTLSTLSAYSSLEQPQQEKHSGSSYRISNALLESQNRRPTLWSQEEEAEEAALLASNGASLSIKGRDGETLKLSIRHRKILFALALFADMKRGEEDVQRCINNLPYDLKHSNIINSPVTLNFNVVELARCVYGKSRVGGYEVKAIAADLEELAQTRCYFSVTNEGETITFKDAFINYTAVTKDKGGKIINDYSQVTLRPIFLYNLTKSGGYSLAPKTVLYIWNEYLDDREITAHIFTALLRVRGMKIKAAAVKEHELQAEHRKKKISPEESAKIIRREKRKALTFQITLDTLLGSLQENKRYYKGKTLRRDNIKADITKTQEGLKAAGIITEFWEDKATSSGCPKYNFLINENWLEDQSKRLTTGEE